MNSPKSLEMIHDLFSSAQHKSEDNIMAECMPLHVDLYEQIAKLESIDMDEMVQLLQDDGAPISPHEPITLGDFFEGLAQLATMGVVEITDIVEAIHREVILRPIGRFHNGDMNKWQRGITGRIYGTIRHVMLLVGNNMSSALKLYKSVTSDKKHQPLPESLKKLVNVFNGVMGDHLVNNNNALAVPMALYDSYGQIQDKEVSGRVIILCHGLCMSHLSWQPSDGVGLGECIMRSQPDATVLYLDYNTGRRISSNGHTLSKTIQALVDNNLDITQIDLVGHSMGGLVARSALFYGKQDRLDWIKGVGNLITLGAPHHGAILERVGFFVQDIIAKLPFAGSLAKLGDMRSAGIIDLRHGSIRDADWNSLEGRSVVPHDFRHPASLPRHVNTYFGAATLIETHYGSKVSNLIGDGLVTIDSALGEHADEHTLILPEGNKAIFYGVSHMNLMYNERVHQQVVAWLLDNGKSNRLQGSHSARIHSYPDTMEVVI